MKKKLMTLEQRRLLREAQQLLALSERQKAKKKTSEASESGDNTNTTVRLTRQVMDFLTKRYDFRYNLLTEETEFRPAGQRDFAFLPVGKRNLNAFCIEAHAEGIPCWDLKQWLAGLEPEQRERTIDTVYHMLCETNAETLHELKENRFSRALALLRSAKGLDEDTRKLLVHAAGVFFRSAARFRGRILPEA